MVRWRLLSAAVGIPVGVALVWVGGVPFAVAVWALAAMGLWELAQGLRQRDIVVLKEIAFPCTLAWLVGAHRAHDAPAALFHLWVGMAALTLFGSMTAHIFWRRGEPVPAGWRLHSIAATVFSALYISMFAFPLLLRHWSAQGEGAGRAIVLTLLATVWGTDATAFFVGTHMGKHPIAPQVSPGKTVEGALSGIAGGVVAAVLCWWVLSAFKAAPSVPLPTVALFAVVVSAVGQLGDLGKSVLKRDLGIKDFGALIPGHGGVLDRFDSLLITAPLVYFAALWRWGAP